MVLARDLGGLVLVWVVGVWYWSESYEMCIDFIESGTDLVLVLVLIWILQGVVLSVLWGVVRKCTAGASNPALRRPMSCTVFLQLAPIQIPGGF